MSAYHVLLYYNFQPIEDTGRFCEDHKRACRDLNIKGRIYVASEGLNGTVAGTSEQTESYKSYLRNIPGFGDTEFKEDVADFIPFRKLIVKTRPEIVSLKVPEPVVPGIQGGRHLKPHEWRSLLESDEDYVLIDVRNNYESRIGHFEGAVNPDVENFYDFPEWLENASIAKDKKVLMYCTGGIRCEKFSALMKNNGYRDVNQLEGGILRYAHEENGAHFKGKCFVFDDRLAVSVNPDDDEPISFCEITGKPCDTYINCANMECNRLFICSEEGARIMDGCCSETCRQSPYKRPFDPDRIYAPFRKWYHYFESDFKIRKNIRSTT